MITPCSVSKNEVLVKIKEIKSTELISQALLKADEWNQIENQINSQCKDVKNYKACEGIASVRHELLMKYRAHK